MVSRATLLHQLGHECAVAFWPEPQSLLDPVPGESLVVDVPLRAQLLDRGVLRDLVEPLGP